MFLNTLYIIIYYIHVYLFTTSHIYLSHNCLSKSKLLVHVDSGYEHVQFTLVDCPGHASLIRTIIGGQFTCKCMYILICYYS